MCVHRARRDDIGAVCVERDGQAWPKTMLNNTHDDTVTHTNRTTTREAPYSRTTKRLFFLGKTRENISRFALVRLNLSFPSFLGKSRKKKARALRSHASLKYYLVSFWAFHFHIVVHPRPTKTPSTRHSSAAACTRSSHTALQQQRIYSTALQSEPSTQVQSASRCSMNSQPSPCNSSDVGGVEGHLALLTQPTASRRN